MSGAPVFLYAMPGSLYSGKARSYLRKAGISFIERGPGHPRFGEAIVPAAKRWIIPVVELPTGEIIQDGAVIIDHFEALTGHRFTPPGPRQKVVSAIFELFGGEGLLRPAMHYRWNFDAENLTFLKRDFTATLVPGDDGEMADQVFAMSSGRMRQAGKLFGVTPETAPMIEQAYLAFLDLFDQHLKLHPYLLGGKPCRGDFGLYAALYAHLARDPAPSQIMKQRAFRVWRWTERMSVAEADMPDFPGYDEDFLADDMIPESVVKLLAYVAEDYLPEVRAFCGFIGDYLDAHPEISPGDVAGGKPSQRGLGKVRFTWRGLEIEAGVLPYRLYLLNRVQAVADGLPAADQTRVATLLSETGLAEFLSLRPRLNVARAEHWEVWAARG